MADLAQLPRTTRGASLRGARRPSHQQRYMAFLSYSHDDAEMAEWLHESLEEFRVPARLVGQLTDQGPVPKKLSPIFRDRHELAASPDLGEEIEEAISGSRFLIVLCSPSAAKSRWIDEEIACFKRLHQEDLVLAAIVDGEPFASDMPGREHEECFPPSLRVHFDRRGRPTSQRAEPIAADLREVGDGKRLGLLKIAAGMMGVGLDELAQREAQRRHRRLYLVTAASVAGMLFTSGLAYTAIDARDEARDQRREAEGLIGFMLGDLRQKLEPLGRLDVLDSVGTRALAYYESQDKSGLSDESLAQRSRALTLMGEMAQARGDLDGALRRYQEAMASTAELARRSPDSPQNLFNHAQNVFWVGAIDYQRGDVGKAEVAWREYRRLADRMIALAPKNADYQLERIYADTNLGTVLMNQRRFSEAASAYQSVLEPTEALQAKDPSNKDLQTKLIDTLAWLADAREFSGQIDEALAHRQRELALIDQLWSADKPDTELKRDELTARRAIARMLAYRGQIPQAIEQARKASATSDWLTKTEPQNTEWLQAGAQANFDRAGLELAAGHISDAQAVAQTACNASDRLLATDRSVAIWRTELQLRCLGINARIALKSGRNGEAVAFARQAIVLARTEQNSVKRGLAVGQAEQLLGGALLATAQRGAARGAFERALIAWPKNIEERPSELADHSILLRRLGRSNEANVLRQQLSAMGYRHPDYLSNRQQGG
jgi:tetratricopeptide (TPR) repeat protein